MVAGHLWTIEINGYSRKYSKISFERKLDMNSPTKFKAKIAYPTELTGDPAIRFMNTVTFKRNGTVEWSGYVEDMSNDWDKDGRFLNLQGRDASFILWKKYLEDFSNYVEKTAGFFGQVSAVELMLFLMRTPHSDPCNLWDAVNGWTLQYPNNKEGWGLDTSKLTCSAERTSAGDPQYAKLRTRGFGWRNSGNQWASAIMNVDSIDLVTWAGTGTPPYLNQSDYVHNYVKSNVSSSGPSSGAVASFEGPPSNLPSTTPTGTITLTEGSNEVTGVGTNFLSFQTGDQIGDGYGNWFVINTIASDTLMYLSSPSLYSVSESFDGNIHASLTGINSLSVELWFKTDGSWNPFDVAHFSVWVWVDSQGNWEELFDQIEQYQGVGGTGWTPRVVDLSNLIKTYSDLENIQIRVENESGANLSSYIGYMRLFLSYVSSGTQNGPNSIMGAQDYFDIKFPDQNIMGIYFESRMDNDSYPRHYEIVSLNPISEIFGAGTGADFRTPPILGALAWTAVNPTYFVPNGVGSDIDIGFLFNSYSTETAKNYQDYGVGGLSTYDFSNGFKLSTTSEDLHLATIFCASDTEGSRNQLDANGSAHFVALDISTLGLFIGGSIVGFVVNICIDSHYPSVTDSVSSVLQLGTQYYFEVKHVDGTLYIKIWSDTTTLYNKSFAYPYALRYLYNAQTWGASESFSESIYNPATIEIDTRLGTPIANLGDWVGHDSGAFSNPWTYYAFGDTENKWIGIQAGPAEIGSEAFSFCFNALLSSSGQLYTGGTITDGILKIRARLYNGGSGHYDEVSVRPLVSIDGVNWYGLTSGTDFEVLTTDWAEYTLDLTEALHKIKDPFTLVNGVGIWEVQIKLKLTGYSGPPPDENHGGVEICWMRWHLDGTGSWDNTGLNGSIQETSFHQGETQLVPEVTNDGSKGGPFIDCVHSWNLAKLLNTTTPTINNIRIRITGDDSDHGWAISQVYVYGATEIRLRPFLGGVNYPSDGSYPIAYPSNTVAPDDAPALGAHYTGGPYINYVNIDLVDFVNRDIATPVGPINISRSRVLDAINFVVQQCYELEYATYEWWLDPDTTSGNIMHISDQKGSDKSQNGDGTITFEKANEPTADPSHGKAGGVKREKYIDDTVQRVYVVGEGEQKTQQEASVWVENADAMDELGTFYEELDHEKSLTPDQKGNPSVAELIGEVYLMKNAVKRDQTVVKVTKDPYDTMDYDTGDEVSVVDNLTKTIATEFMRILNIDKDIDSNGEVVTIYLGQTVGSARYRFEDEMQNIYGQLRKIGAVGVIKPDWTAQGIDQTQIDANSISKKSDFEKSAKNEEASADKDIRSAAWDINPDPASSDYKDYDPSGGKKYQSVPSTHGMYWNKTSDWMQLQGPTDDAGVPHSLRVAIVQDDLQDILDITMDRNPSVVFEVKCYEVQDGGTPTYWKDGDYFVAGIRGNSTDGYDDVPSYDAVIAGTATKVLKGFWFYGTKLGGIIKLYACYNLTGNAADTQMKYIRDIKVGAQNTLDALQKYRLEIVCDNTMTMPNGDITSNPNGTVTFNVYDLNTPDGSGEKNPATVIGLFNGTDPASITVVPLWALISGTKGTNQRCQLYIYRYKTEWTRCKNP